MNARSDVSAAAGDDSPRQCCSNPRSSLTWIGVFALSVALAVAFTAGCASRAPDPMLVALPPIHAATLDAPGALMRAPSAAPSSAMSTAPAPVLLVRRVGVPEYVASRRIRYWTDASTLAEWPNAYWAERLEIGITREYVAALRRALPGWTVCEGTCPDRAPALTVTARFLRLDMLRQERMLHTTVQIEVATPGGAAGSTPSAPDTFERWVTPADSDTVQGQAKAISDVLTMLATRTAGRAVELRNAALRIR